MKNLYFGLPIEEMTTAQLWQGVNYLESVWEQCNPSYVRLCTEIVKREECEWAGKIEGKVELE